jgi:hypothetical protein
MLGFDRAGGMPLSKREVDRIAALDDKQFDAAVREELL